jgi:Transglutaminase-like superfamily
VKVSAPTREKTEPCAESCNVLELGARPVSRLKRFARMSLAEQVLLLRALFLVSAIRLGLFLFPFRLLQRFAQRRGRKSNTMYSSGEYVWAVRAVSRYVPGATCLTQALAAQRFLTRSGHASHIEIGVKKDEQRRFLAHAWVVSGDQIVIGGAEADGYVPLEAWGKNSASLDKP